MKKVLLVAVAALAMVACTNKKMSENPFFTEWNTVEGVPPFEQILPCHYLPAFNEGIRLQNEAIEAIIANQEVPTFENTIEALDRSDDFIARVAGVFFNITESDGSPELDSISEIVLPLVAEQGDNVYMNAALFERVKVVYETQDEYEYTNEQKRLIKKVYDNFVRNGIALPEEKQEVLRQINKELAGLQQRFGQNLLAQTNAYQLVLETEEDLVGLPQSVREAYALAAKNAGMEGKYLVGLSNPSRLPFLQYSERRDLREDIYKAYINRCNNGGENDNKEIIVKLAALRAQKAQILGYETAADYILDETMAKTAATVDAFLAPIFEAANNKAKEELAQLQACADKRGDNITVEAWDWDYYTEILRQEKYALDDAQLRPYFQMEKVREGVFTVANKLYGLNITKLENMPVFNPEAECFRVEDADGSLIGIFYCDYYPRASKRFGAWMTNFREQYVRDGVDIRPVIVNIGNFTKPTADQPSLLTLDEVETMFHEFGHALHGLLSKANYRMVSGTNVSRDFVELPSQILENWAFEPEVLALYAYHYQTGELIPDSLVKKIEATSTFNQGFITTELTAAAILDMKWHEVSAADCEGLDPIAFEAKMMNQIGLIPQIAPRYRSTYFNHIWAGGYSAGYYSYLWSEVLDKDAFEAFKENGLFDPETAAAFRVLLQSGDTEDPMVLYRNFRGAEPSPEPMLHARGLK